MYSPTQRRDIRLLATLRGASILGDAVALVALFLRLAPNGHAWAIAALAIAGSLPLVLLSPLAGHVVDHVAAKPLLLGLGLTEALICVGLGYWHGVVATLLLMALLSSFVAFSLPGYAALVPYVAGDDNITLAQSLMQTTQGVANILGPVLGGLLVGWSGQSEPLYVDALSFALGAVATMALRQDRRPDARVKSDDATERMMAGVSLLGHDRVLRPLVLTLLVFLLSLGTVNIAEVFFVTRTLHGSATLYGLVGSSFGLGTVVGSLGSRRLRSDHVRLARSVLVAITVVGVMIGLEGLVRTVYAIFPLLFVAGLAVGVANVAWVTLFTLRTPEALRGRLFAAVGALVTASEVGAMVTGGLILSVVAPRTVFQIGGGAATISALVLGPLALRASATSHARERST